MRIVFVLLACSFSSMALAQSWTASRVSLSWGGHETTNRSSQESRFRAYSNFLFSGKDFTGYEPSDATRELSGQLGLRFHIKKQCQQYHRLEREIRIGMNGHFGRSASFDYSLETTINDQQYQERWIAQIKEHEFGIGVEHLWRLGIREFTVYSGLGISASTALDVRINQLITGDTSEDFTILEEGESYNRQISTQENIFYSRVNLPLGVEYRRGQLCLGVEYGLGMSLQRVGSFSTTFKDTVLGIRIGMVLS